MNQEPHPRSWWQTVPGMLTAFAATLTAATGFLIALNQIGWLSKSETPVSHISASELQTSTSASLTETRAAPTKAGAGARDVPVLEPAIRRATLGEAIYDLLSVRTEPRNLDSFELHILVRATNNGRYPGNFWDSTFRLLIDGVPRAPVSGLNLVVAAQSAEDGEVVFHVPLTATSLVLRLQYDPSERVDIPLQRVGR